MSFQQKSWWLGFCLIIVFWLLLVSREFPAPFIDDANYIGAAINLAQHGVFANTICECLKTIGCGSPFFDYMPLHSFVLAGWLKVAGVSALSFHIFYTSLALSISLLIFRLFPAGNYAWLYGLLICVTVFELLDSVGLRPDALGLLFVVLGLDLYRSKSFFLFFLKNVFLGMAVITFPNLALVAILISVSSLIYLRVAQQYTMQQLLPWALAIAIAYLACFLLFLALIDGLLFKFLKCLAVSGKMSAITTSHRFHPFTALGITKWIIVQSAFLALVVALIARWRRDPSRKQHFFFLVISLLVFFILAYSSISSATGAHLWAFACLIASLFIIAKEGWGTRALGLWLVMLIVATFGHAHFAIEDCLADRPISPERREALLAEIAHLNPPRLYVDAYAMRELYDYRLPDNAFAFETASTKGWGTPGPGWLPPDAIMVVSVRMAFPTKLSPDAGKQGRPLQILGHPVKGVFKNPYDLVIMDNRD